MAGPAIEASFGMDLEPLKRGFAEANNIARTEAPKVAQTIRNSTQTMWSGQGGASGLAHDWSNPLSDRVRRSTAAIRGGYLPPARPGQYLPVEEEPVSPTGGRRGLMRGIGGFSLLTGLHEAAGYVGRKNEEAAQLRDRISDADSLNSVSAIRKELARRDAIERAGPLGMFVRGGRQLAESGTVPGGATHDEEEKGRLRQQAINAISKQTDEQKALNRAERENQAGHEQRSALLLAEIKNRQRLTQIAKEATEAGVPETERRASSRAENARYALEVANIKKTVSDSAMPDFRDRRFMSPFKSSKSELSYFDTNPQKFADMRNVVRTIKAGQADEPDYYKNIGQDAGDLMRGMMGTNQLGMPVPTGLLGLGINQVAQTASRMKSAADQSSPDATMGQLPASATVTGTGSDSSAILAELKSLNAKWQ